jgi:hypothetical protein
MYNSPSQRSAEASLMREGMIAMTHTNLRLVDETFVDKTKAGDPARLQIERAFGIDSIATLGKNERTELAMVEAIGPEAGLFALAIRSI